MYIEGKKTPVQADTIRIADVLKSPAYSRSKEQTVAKIHNSVNEGLYMPLTASGNIVVAAVIASY